LLTFDKTVEDLSEIRDIGPETAQNIINYFANNKELISQLLNHVEIQFEN